MFLLCPPRRRTEDQALCAKFSSLFVLHMVIAGNIHGKSTLSRKFLMPPTTFMMIIRLEKADSEAFTGVGQIAVKRLKAMSAKAEMEFAVEVEILGRVRHKNLLGLRGFYAGGDERLIVYDYMPNHSLIAHLHGQLADDCLLDWHRRMNIRDIVQWAAPYVEKGAFDHIADPRLKGRYDRAQLKTAIMVAMRCTDSNPENRPTMMKVVEWLNGGLGRTKVVEDQVGEDAETDYKDMEYDDSTDYDGMEKFKEIKTWQHRK
ncbi:hypothetical protein SADUNF_Sadunf15G0113200 [Salix dunnii]|uniref:non-specific serine/threonine protein kinase n=1 Tax=Salix dunnii TaxID=1413687 RepID=A0A835MJ01_9ROSI|nr:hypothetical protein SADUNF_Sadunf15G0113200 [Salix dunnii]